MHLGHVLKGILTEAIEPISAICLTGILCAINAISAILIDTGAKEPQRGQRTQGSKI